MAWTTPKTDFATNDLVTAAQMNAIGANLQYLHDNRWYNLMTQAYDSADDYIFDIGRTTYTFDATNIMWPGSHIDTDDVEVYFWGLLGVSNGPTATACAILWDNDAGASIVDSWIASGSTNPGTMACPALSVDISDNMPTGIVNLQIRYRATAGSELRWNGYGILVVG